MFTWNPDNRHIIFSNLVIEKRILGKTETSTTDGDDNELFEGCYFRGQVTNDCFTLRTHLNEGCYNTNLSTYRNRNPRPRVREIETRLAPLHRTSAVHSIGVMGNSVSCSSRIHVQFKIKFQAAE